MNEHGKLPEPLAGLPALTARAWKEQLFHHLNNRQPQALEATLAALNAYPQDPQILLMTVIAALLDEKPEAALRYLQRFTKRFTPAGLEEQLLKAVALAEQGIWRRAWQIVEQYGKYQVNAAVGDLPIGYRLYSWFHNWTERIEREERRRLAAEKKAEKEAAKKRATKISPQTMESAHGQAAVKAKSAAETAGAQAIDGASELPALPRYQITIPLSISLPTDLDAALTGLSHTSHTQSASELEAFRLRYELTQLGLLQGFDELLCLPTLHGVETHWYQIEAVRKALKQFRGRVLLADEVGLGKTIEAGMILKEYLLRGMVERVLILTPATLVGQWRDELATKFDLNFATSYDAQLKTDPTAFWSQPRVIASIATARRAEHQELLAQQNYDLVIVDEAHHLKNRATANWKLVNALQKRFLLLLSATPVQNSLVELYNLLTLLKPGIFKTEKEFRASYMTSGQPRVPANREHMRDLMREVMIRNTRSLVDVHLPPRHAVTLKLDPEPEEAACYQTLSRLVAEAHAKSTSQQRLALRYLLSAAGSTAATAAAAIHRYLAARRADGEWRKLLEAYSAIQVSGKEKSLLDLLRRNEAEKKIVFVHHRETLRRLADWLTREALSHVVFEGAMSGPEKDAAIARFRDEVPLLISTESGGEGRNLQFANTLINFDLPWNPMAIEQRIGRLHRIGQTREVFIFNLVARETLEERILHILDEKINMFELVVGEIDAILGEMGEEEDFAEMVFNAWVATTEADRAAAFEDLGARLQAAREQYETVKALDEELFGEEFVAG